MTRHGGPRLPLVLLPLGVDDTQLDATLAALDAGTPPGTQVWIADDAQAGPRSLAIVERWLSRTPLQAEYTRRQRPIGEVAHLDDALQACGDRDVAVLAADAQVLPGWLQALEACFRGDAAIASATPWCNAGEVAAWPLLGTVNPLPSNPAQLAAACATVAPGYPELPAAVDHAVLLRGRARQRAGGLDAASFESWYAALIDLSQRLSGLGRRNVLCDAAFVARGSEGGPQPGDQDALAIRWPGWQARLAQFLMHDPIYRQRQALQQALHASASPTLQADLFPAR